MLEDFEDWEEEDAEKLGVPKTGYSKTSFIEDTARGVFTTSLTDKNGRLMFFGQLDNKENFRVTYYLLKRILHPKSLWAFPIALI